MTEETKTIQVRRDTAANWSTRNPIPKAGEWCFETDTGITKIGDGATYYNNLVPFRQTTATKTELDKLHDLATTNIELGYVHGVTSAIQTQLDSKVAKADIQTSFGEILSDEKVASEKLVKNSLDIKQDDITTSDNIMLKASVLSAMTIVGENNSGRRYDEPKTLAKMISAAHSTFDLSKFTVVGSPNITNNGILISSANNYIKTIDTFNFGVFNSWEIIIKINISSFSSGQNIFYVNQSNLNTIFADVLTNGKPRFLGWATPSGAMSGILFNYTATFTLSENTDYWLSYKFTGTNYLIGYSTDGQNFIYESASETTIKCNCNGTLEIGTLRGASPLLGTTDLKRVTVIADGVEVFSSNKTGIDVIKPDDYTTVGTPTISADGVYTSSTTNADNYIALTGFNASGDLTLEFDAYFDGGTYNGFFLNATNGSPSQGEIYIGSYGVSGYGTTNLGSTDFIQSGHSYKFKIEYNKNGTATVSIKKDTASSWLTSDGVSWTDLPTRFLLAYRYNNAGVVVIDLNNVKIYSQGDLVYQPCLKIPYTLAANDKKFISPIYEDRAKDMADQFGVAPYYILDEDNGNFAFPYGSVEEKVAPKIVVGHYEDGASAWEQYLDRTMIQRGTMIADTEVTFPCSDEFATTDFALSCPFSAKTTTGFTPSASGTYIAIGKF